MRALAHRVDQSTKAEFERKKLSLTTENMSPKFADFFLEETCLRIWGTDEFLENMCYTFPITCFVNMLLCNYDFVIMVSYYDVLCSHDEPIVMFSVPSFPPSNNSQDTTSLIERGTKRNVFIIFIGDT